MCSSSSHWNHSEETQRYRYCHKNKQTVTMTLIISLQQILFREDMQLLWHNNPPAWLLASLYSPLNLLIVQSFPSPVTIHYQHVIHLRIWPEVQCTGCKVLYNANNSRQLQTNIFPVYILVLMQCMSKWNDNKRRKASSLTFEDVSMRLSLLAESSPSANKSS